MARGFRAFSPQFGVETTYATPVASPKVLSGLALDIGPEIQSSLIDLPGYAVPSGVEIGEVMTAADVKGKLALDQAPYLFASVLDKTVTPTAAAGGVAAKQWLWSLNPLGGQVGQSYTVRYGDGTASRDYQINGAIFNGFKLDITRAGIEFASKLIGRKWITGVSKTGGPTAVQAKFPQPKAFSIWMDDTWAGLGGSQLLAAYKAGINVEGRWAPDWPVNASLDSFNGVIPAESPGFSAQMTLGVDATSDALIASFDVGAVKFPRVKYVGPIVDGTAAYTLQADMAIVITSVGKIQSFNGVAVIPFDYSLVFDPVSSKTMEVTVICATAAL